MFGLGFEKSKNDLLLKLKAFIHFPRKDGIKNVEVEKVFA